MTALTRSRLTLIQGGRNIDAELLDCARRWARLTRPRAAIAAVRLEPGAGKRWIVIDWADGQHLRRHLDGHDGWRDPPPLKEREFDQLAYDAVDGEAEHFIICPDCGQAFDARDLKQVLHHQRARHFPIPRS